MEFNQYLENWLKGELAQGKTMIGIGLLLFIICFFIIKHQDELLKGMLIPFGILLIIFIGYGGYILYSRPAHVKQSTILYASSPKNAIEKEIQKHRNDNKTGKTLLKIYPILAILSIIVLIFLSSPYYKGVAIGFAILFLSTYIIDNGFITRSDKIIKNITAP